jgi:hypothetical protein
MPRIVLASLIGMIVLCGCRTNMVPYEAGDTGNPRKVLIAGEHSEFKENVVIRIIETLGTEEWYFRVIGLDQLQEQETEPYGAILLVAAFRAGRLDERVTTYLSKDPQNPKTILFFTRGTEDPLPEKNKPDIQIDAVSSASKDARVELRARELVALIEKRF